MKSKFNIYSLTIQFLVGDGLLCVDLSSSPNLRLFPVFVG